MTALTAQQEGQQVGGSSPPSPGPPLANAHTQIGRQLKSFYVQKKENSGRFSHHTGISTIPNRHLGLEFTIRDFPQNHTSSSRWKESESPANEGAKRTTFIN